MPQKPLLAAFLMLTLAGCSASNSGGDDLLRRSLPATSQIVPDALPLPSRRADGDAIASLAEHRVVAAENGRRLISARRNYEALRQTYAGENP